MCWVRILVFIDDEGAELASEHLQCVESALQIKDTGFIVSGQRECPRDVVVCPRLLPEVIKGADNAWWVIITHHIRATSQQKICRHILNVSEIMDAFLGF
jgi:hypothetical protein